MTYFLEKRITTLTDNYDFEFLKNETEMFVFKELEKQLAFLMLQGVGKDDVENYLEDEDAEEYENVEEDANEENSICLCNECVMDMAAMALNTVKPLYRVSLLGSLYASSAMEDEMYSQSLKEAVASAIEKVRNNPSH